MISSIAGHLYHPDTPSVDRVSTGRLLPHNQQRRPDVVTNGVDGCSKDHVFEASVPVGAHNHQIRVQLFGIAHNLFPWIVRVTDDSLSCNVLTFKALSDLIQIRLPGLDLRG